MFQVHESRWGRGALLSTPALGQRQLLSPERCSSGEQPSGTLVRGSGASTWSRLPSLVHLRKKSAPMARLSQKGRNCVVHIPVHCELPGPPAPSRGGCRPLQTIVLWSGPRLSHCRMHFLLPNL